MVEILKSPVERAGDELMQALLNRLEGRKAGEIAATAQVQAVMTKAALQALIDILVTKGIVPESELAAAMKHHYNRSHDQLVYSTQANNNVIVTRPQ